MRSRVNAAQSGFSRVERALLRLTRMKLSRLRLVAVVVPLLLAACGQSSESTLGAIGPGGDSRAIPSTGSGREALPGETYGKLIENDWVDTSQQPTSTFGIDVDTGSYSLMRRDVQAKRAPNQDGVRPEEYINYFDYGYAPPTDGKPFAVHLDGAPSVFGQDYHLVRVAMQGAPIDEAQRQHANLVFLVDVSGSMGDPNKLPLVKYTLQQLVSRLRPTDTLAIVTYAGSSSVLLPPTPVVDKDKITAGIEALTTGGGTNGEGGIRKAYELAEQAKVQDQRGPGINRVVLCTDGDFNVGLTGGDLVKLIEEKRDTGVTLTTLGFGQGNYNDREMERLADHGNGNYAYVDSKDEADRIVGKRFVSMLQVIAKDTKIQIDFKPEVVSKYRLVGYENRVLAKEDFEDDKKDSGDLGAGHNVTAFYEVALTPAAKQNQLATAELATVKLRYKLPSSDQSELLERSLPMSALASSFDAAPASFRFAAATAEYAEILRRSKHSEGARFDDVLGILRATAGEDNDKKELIELVESAKTFWK